MRLEPTKVSFFRAEIEKFFVRFLVQVKMAKSPFEINWPLKKKRKYVLRKTWPKSKKFWTQIASENSSSAPCWLWLLKKPKIWKLKSKRQSKLVFWTSEALKHRISPSMANLIAKMPCPSMWPKQFWLVQNGFGLTKLDLTIMIWSRPKWNGHDQNELVRFKCDSLD